MHVKLARFTAFVGSALLLISTGCGDDDDCCYVDPPTSNRILFGNEGNRMHAYDVATGDEQVVVPSHDDDPAHGRDINGQICFAPDGSGIFVAGEDTGQPNPPQGWGIFQLHGQHVGELSATQIGKLVPTYRTEGDNAENYGCAFLSDGRVLTTDVGDQASGPPTG